MPTIRRPTKAESKRVRAEAARAAMARAQRRSRTIRLAGWSAAGLVVVAVAVTIIVLLDRSDTPVASSVTPAPVVASSVTPTPAVASSVTPTPAVTGATGRTGNPPWSAPSDASAAVAAAGLPMLGAEGTALHIHVHLDIVANGTAVQVPADIGVDEARRQISPLHSHDTSGVVHVESPAKDATFTLGQFFTEWQVSLSADHIGGLATDATHHLRAYVNGTLHPGDPAGIVLAAHDEIVIVYGTDAQQTNVPTSYRWTNGL